MTDERPKPKYGELAPEGWVWQPPAEATPDAATPDAETPSASPAPASAPGPARNATQDVARGGASANLDDAVKKPIATGDLIATVLLLVVGFFATINSVTSLLNLPALIQEVLDVQGLDVTYTATAAANLIGTIGSVVLVLLFAAAVWLSVKAVRARRVAFYIPLAIAVLSFMVLFFVLILAFFADGAIVNAMMSASQP